MLSVELQVSHDAARPLRHRGRYRLHLGTAEVSVVLALLEANSLGSDGTGLGQLFLAEPVVAVHGQPFVLREESPPATLGGGRVLQPSARRIRRRDHVAVARLARLRSPDPDERLSAALAFLGMTPWTERTLCRASGIEIGEVSRALARLSDAGKLVELPLGPRRHGPGAGRVRGRPGRPRAPRPGAAPRGPAPAVGHPPVPRRGHLARHRQRHPGRRAPRSAQGPGQGGLRRADRGAAGARAQAEPGGAAAQGRAGRGDPLEGVLPAGRLRAGGARRAAEGDRRRAAGLAARRATARRGRPRPLPRFRRRGRAAPARGRAAGRRLADHHGRAARPARHHPQVRRADRRIPRPDRPDPARGRHPSPGRPGRQSWPPPEPGQAPPNHEDVPLGTFRCAEPSRERPLASATCRRSTGSSITPLGDCRATLGRQAALRGVRQALAEARVG